MSFQTKQKGFSLFIVMIVMLVIALLVVATSQSTSTEMRMSTNEADRKYALGMAESGLRDAEARIQSLMTSVSAASAAAGTHGVVKTFDYNCTGGYCAPVEPASNFRVNPLFNITGTKSDDVAWKRKIGGKDIWTTTTNTIAGTNSNVKYIIEYLGERKDSAGTITYNFRVTSRAEGQNPNTIVFLQSYVELTPSS